MVNTILTYQEDSDVLVAERPPVPGNSGESEKMADLSRLSETQNIYKNNEFVIKISELKKIATQVRRDII